MPIVIVSYRREMASESRYGRYGYPSEFAVEVADTEEGAAELIAARIEDEPDASRVHALFAAWEDFAAHRPGESVYLGLDEGLGSIVTPGPYPDADAEDYAAQAAREEARDGLRARVRGLVEAMTRERRDARARKASEERAAREAEARAKEREQELATRDRLLRKYPLAF